jgi:hypothetical protein
MSIPTEGQFTDGLGARKIASEPADGYWCYEFRDLHGFRLELSVNTHERSVQTVLSFDGREVQRTSSEGGTRVWLETQSSQTVLKAECKTAEAVTSLSIVPNPIALHWATLVI